MTKYVRSVAVISGIIWTFHIYGGHGYSVSTESSSQTNTYLNNTDVTHDGQSTHRKAKYGTRDSDVTHNGSYKLLFDKFLMTARTHDSIYSKCSKFSAGSHSDIQQCVYMYYKQFRKAVNKLSMNSKGHRYSQRKLLSVGNRPQRVSASAQNKPADISTVSEIANEEYAKFLEVVRRKLSKDPQRAMFSVLGLLILMMVAIKLCGMRPIKQNREIPKDFQDDVQYLGIYDILKLKKPYLPIKILQWNRKVRRKLRKKRPVIRVKEPDFSIPAEDVTDEETPLFGRVYDF